MEIEKALKYSRLLDFYGNLLTDKQREVASMLFFDDISLSEIAGLNGLTRQAVFDLVRRVKSILDDYENKLGLYGKYIESKKFLEKHLNEDSLSCFSKIWEN